MKMTLIQLQYAVAATAERLGARMRDRSGDERGQAALEYLGILVLVALIVVAVVGTGIAKDIANGISSQVSKVVNVK